MIVTASFAPEVSPRSFRATERARELARQGHAVTVVTPRSAGIPRLWDVEKRVYLKDMGPPRFHLPHFGETGVSRFLTRITGRFLTLFFEFPDIQYMFLIRKALAHEEGYDLLISVAVPYPVHWGVALVHSPQRRIATTWVADCGDPYMGNRLDRFRKPFYFRYAEKWFMRKCDYVTIPREEFKINFYPEFHQRMVAIPQGFRFEEVNRLPRHSPNGIPRFAFAGSLIRETRDPGKFLTYLASLSGAFHFILYTRSTELVAPFLLLLNGKMEVRDYIPRDELLRELAGMDFLVNFEYDPMVQSPSKLIDYALTGRPVLNINAKTFSAAVVDAFLVGDYRQRFEFPDLEKFRIEHVAASFLKLIDGNRAGQEC